MKTATKVSHSRYDIAVKGQGQSYFILLHSQKASYVFDSFFLCKAKDNKFKLHDTFTFAQTIIKVSTTCANPENFVRGGPTLTT